MMDIMDKLKAIKNILHGFDERDMTAAEFEIWSILEGKEQAAPRHCQDNSKKIAESMDEE